MKVLLDTNIILDILQKRSPWYNEDIIKIWSAITSRKITGYIAGNSIDNLDYIMRRMGVSKTQSRAILRELTEVLYVSSITRQVCQKALMYDAGDIEDQIAYASAEAMEIDYIVTRNTKDFPASGNPIALNPADLLRHSMF